jgi:hypothetical protein
MKPVHPAVQWLTLLLALCISFTLVVLYMRIQNVQKHENDALHSIICQAEHAVQVRPGIPPAQRHQAIRFYRAALANAHLDPCER